MYEALFTKIADLARYALEKPWRVVGAVALAVTLVGGAVAWAERDAIVAALTR
jgi:hypothetical protein